MKTYHLNELNKDCVSVWGRFNGELSPLTLFWTGSGLELNVQASELAVTFYTDYSFHEQWISIFVNDALIARQMLPKGESQVTIFRNMNPQEIKNVRIHKEVQAMADDPLSLFQITALATDGCFHKVEDKKLHLEFIGDSITSGEGTMGAKKEWDWISMFFSSAYEYGMLAGNDLDAKVQIFSQSGWGTVTGWDNDPRHVMPPHYPYLASILQGDRNEAFGVKNTYDTSEYNADYVFINLGTNDCGAMDQPPFTVPESGEVFAQRKENGKVVPEDRERLIKTAIDFLKALRKGNPKARLVWILGMLGDFLCPIFEEAVLRYQKETGDDNSDFLKLADNTKETSGSREHPGKACHRMAADTIVSYIRRQEA